MCGIAGFCRSIVLPRTRRLILRRMAMALANEARMTTGTGGMPELGRICASTPSIIDLSPEGRQPMTSASGRYVIVNNERSTTSQELRRELEGHGVTFRGGSDTEVMLAAIECRASSTRAQFAGHVRVRVVRSANGYTVTRAGPLGEKPLYYGRTGRTLLFGSELKACGRIPMARRHRSRRTRAVHFATTTSLRPIRLSGIRKVRPWHDRSHSKSASPWRATRGRLLVSRRAACGKWLASAALGSEDDLAEELDALLRGSFGGRCSRTCRSARSCLGGIDSSLIVALMQGAIRSSRAHRSRLASTNLRSTKRSTQRRSRVTSERSH